MKHRLGKLRRQSYLLCSLILAALVAIPAAALADQFVNDVDATVDANFEQLALNTGGSDTVTITLNATTGGSDPAGCNISAGSIGLKAASSDSSVASVKWSDTGTDTVSFSGCGKDYAHDLTVTAGSTQTTGGNEPQITFSIVSNTTGVSNNRFDLNTARFKVQVTPPPNTPPVVSVTGVSDGATYEIGSVPAAGCDVNDAEDGSQNVTPTLSAISGPLANYGLGVQSATCSYTDTGGSTVTAKATYSIVDTGAPTITDLGPTPSTPDGNNGWYKSSVTNKFRASDAGAGFADHTNPYEFEESSGTDEGSAVKISSGPVFDVAGNENPGIDAGPFKIDMTNPVVNCGSDDGSWHNTNVQISCTASDSLSGLNDPGDASFSLSTNVPEGTETDNAQTDSRDVYDQAGNKTTVGPITGIKVDRKPPEVSLTYPTDKQTLASPPTQITATFNDLMQDSTVLQSGTVKLEQVLNTGPYPIKATVSYDPSSKTVKIVPSSSLKNGVYKVTITTAAKDKAGNPLSQSYVWQFKVGR